MRDLISPGEVRKLLSLLFSNRRTVTTTAHFREELDKDGMTMLDAERILRGGYVEPGELERGTYRYRVRLSGLGCVVVTFRSETEIVAVTTWREPWRR